MNNKTATVRKRGFFDSSDAPEENVWQQAPLDYFSKLSKRLEDSFYIKEDESSNQWGNCILFLAGSYLVCKSKKHGNSLKYVKLDDGFYKIDVIKVNKKKGEKKSLVGFAITKNGCRAEYLSKKSSVFLKWRNELTKYCIMTGLEENYRTLNVIGSGGYGKVFLLEEVLTKTKWAGKFIKINPQKSREKQLAMIRNEILALRKIDHPNIVELREIYELDDEVCLVMEYIAGKRLFDEIVKTKGIPERDTALIMKQLFSILNYLEFKDIIHRDIKPENLIVSRGPEDEIHLKLIDFGLAAFHTKRDIIKRGGTAGYVAPEVLNNEFYDFKADLYSAGVIMYTCLTGKPLFYALNYNELLEKNKKGVLKFGGKSWNKISHKARDLLQNILEPNTAKRITLDKALNHPWLAAELTSQERGEMLDNTTKFGQMDVPKEKSISKVPGSLEMIPQFNKAPTNPESQTHSNSGHSASSATWFTSRFAMESGAYILNSFYKGVSKDSSEKDKSCNDLDAMNNDPKANVLTLPKQKALAQQRSLPAPSLTSLNPDNGQFHYEAGYNIKIHTYNSFTEFDAPNDEEENPCSQKYSQLPNQDMFFDRPNFYEPSHEHPPQNGNQSNPVFARMKNNPA